MLNLGSDRRQFPVICPSCGKTLRVRRFECPACDTAVEGSFSLPVLARLTPDEQDFLIKLVQCGGSLKELASFYRVSYPTVRNRLDALMERVNALVNQETNPELEDNNHGGTPITAAG